MSFFLEKELPATVYASDKPTEEEKWGFVQFPSLSRRPNGDMLLAFQVAEDSAHSYGKNGFLYFVSPDEGKSWRPISHDSHAPGLPLEDGTTLSLETPIAPKADSLPLPAEPADWIPYNYTYSEPKQAYRFDQLPSHLQTLPLRRTQPDGKFTLENAPLALHDDLRIASGGIFPIIFFGALKKLPDNDLLGVFYPSYVTGDTKSGTLLVTSSDNGKSWTQLDRLPYLPDLDYDPKAYMRGGFTEPAAEILDDGSLLLILRTADGTPEPFPGFLECGPLYSVTRSASGSWSAPAPISPFGVMPQLLKLKSGPLILSYGRPGIQIRVSQDQGKSWSAPLSILEALHANPRAETCGYSSLLEDPTDPHRFFIAYSKFGHQKAILVQRCTLKGPYPLPPPPENPPANSDSITEHRYPDKTLALRVPLLDNQPNGLTEGFYQNGNPSFITPYRRGTIHGVQQFFAPEGHLIKTVPYINGKRNGVIRTYDQRGNILRELCVIDDKTIDLIEFLEG